MEYTPTPQKKWISRAVYALVGCGVLAIFFLTDSSTERLGANIFDSDPLPYEGVGLPVEFVPNYSQIRVYDRTRRYEDYASSELIELPTYDPERLQSECSDGSSAALRNACALYSVVYAGNYQLDHTRLGGSHPGVDITLPMGTPLQAVGNGIVTKIRYSEAGFGNHLVLKLQDVPMSTGATQTLHVAYAHLESIEVGLGERVQRGEVIGYSGNTGLSTSPHLHFQIDRDDAPFHPYWPFTGTEARASGLSFFEAVNSGLGQHNVLTYTIDPMLFLQEQEEQEEQGREDVPPPLGAPETEPSKPQAAEEGEEAVAEQEAFLPLEIHQTDQAVFFPGLGRTPASGRVFSDVSRDDPLEPAIVALVSQGVINGYGDGTLGLENRVNRAEFAKMLSQALLEDSASQTDISLIFSDVSPESWYTEDLSVLYDAGLIRGYQDGTMKPEQTISRAELSQILLRLSLDGEDLTADQQSDYSTHTYSDIPEGAWYDLAAGYMQSQGLFFESSQSAFRGAEPVTRREVIFLLWSLQQGHSREEIRG